MTANAMRASTTSCTVSTRSTVAACLKPSRSCSNSTGRLLVTADVVPSEVDAKFSTYCCSSSMSPSRTREAISAMSAETMGVCPVAASPADRISSARLDTHAAPPNSASTTLAPPPPGSLCTDSPAAEDR